MAKEDLLFILKRLLHTDAYLEFLLQLDEADLRTLIACIRDRVDRGKWSRYRMSILHRREGLGMPFDIGI